MRQLQRPGPSPAGWRVPRSWRPDHCNRPRRLRPARYATSPSGGSKPFDVVGLSNLCVDVIVPVDELPPPDTAARQRLLEQLSASPPSQENWEVGGATNFLIAAARLGMHVGAVGHVGASDVYGRYLDSVLQAERIAALQKIAPPHVLNTDLDCTLLCFVLIDPAGAHAFCSRYDFGPWPLLQGVDELPSGVSSLLGNTKAVYTNGFIFDELPLDLIKAAARQAASSGAAVFFDPGPRCFTMRTGSRRVALDAMLDLSDVVLMTEDEALEVTGHRDPSAAAAAILSRPGARTEWCIVKMGADGALLMTRGGADGGQRQVHNSSGACSSSSSSRSGSLQLQAKAIQVDVKDTVGCGDSFAAAVVLGYIRNHDLPSTLVLANAVGAATAMGRGAGTNVARAEQVMALLQGALHGGQHAPQDVHAAIAMLQASLEKSGQAAALR